MATKFEAWGNWEKFEHVAKDRAETAVLMRMSNAGYTQAREPKIKKIETGTGRSGTEYRALATVMAVKR